MKYHIRPGNPLTHLLHISFEVEVSTSDELVFKLPIWRPGRYEAAHYSKNIQEIKFYGEDGISLDYIKPDFSSWRVVGVGRYVVVKYTYYAHRMDAGNSWYDDDQVYINFINCLLYVEGRQTAPCAVKVDLPKGYGIACGMRRKSGSLMAKDYYELVDSPMVASASLTCLDYQSNGISFKVWMQGEYDLDASRMLEDFKKFTDYQIGVMGEFPAGDYHFMNQFTPYKHYHGVEHGNSTVICIGPGKHLKEEVLYSELVGVSSHELFHAWNILKIRPMELLPYDFGRPAVFPTGFVAEGFTTYYGDLFLVRSGVFDEAWYIDELDKLLCRHFHNFGRLNNSVVDSSLDLWVDGYQPGAPNKKSSIYVEGAVIALTLDLLIRKNTSNKKSLDDVMVKLWKEFGKVGKGYDLEDIMNCCEYIFDGDLSAYFSDYVYGTVDKKALIDGLLGHVGCELVMEENRSVLEGYVGIKLSPEAMGYLVTHIHPDSVAEACFSLGDKIKMINGLDMGEHVIDMLKAGQISFEVERDHTVRAFTLDVKENIYYYMPKVKRLETCSKGQAISYRQWLNIS